MPSFLMARRSIVIARQLFRKSQQRVSALCLCACRPPIVDVFKEGVSVAAEGCRRTTAETRISTNAHSTPSDTEADLSTLARGLQLDPLPPPSTYDASAPHAPRRPITLSVEQKRLALKNALRYFPSELHSVLAPEFARELQEHGHIYMYRCVS